MPGLVPGIHVYSVYEKDDVDGRDKPGHDELWRAAVLSTHTSLRPANPTAHSAKA